MSDYNSVYRRMEGIKINIVLGDAFNIEADVIGMKYAQKAHGLDREVIQELLLKDIDLASKLPKIWGFYFAKSMEVVSSPYIIFIGTPVLRELGYKNIREFGRKLIASLASSKPDTKKLALTIHGPGYGLDEIEAFESQLAGIVDSISSDDYPTELAEIVFVERSKGRFKRLTSFLKNLFPDNVIPTPKTGGMKSLKEESTETLRSAGYESESKKKVFVAMPFAKEFDDIFHYGIQGAVNAAGYLCERADYESFTGDIMEWVKKRIASAELVIADLSSANPNVYLEVGYAWGIGTKTVLIIDDTKQLKFDTRGQRCIPYNSIQDLEESLTTELKNLNI